MATSQQTKDRHTGLLLMFSGAGVLMGSNSFGKKLMPYATIIGLAFAITGTVITIKNWE